MKNISLFTEKHSSCSVQDHPIAKTISKSVTSSWVILTKDRMRGSKNATWSSNLRHFPFLWTPHHLLFLHTSGRRGHSLTLMFAFAYAAFGSSHFQTTRVCFCKLQKRRQGLQIPTQTTCGGRRAKAREAE